MFFFLRHTTLRHRVAYVNAGICLNQLSDVIQRFKRSAEDLRTEFYQSIALMVRAFR